MWIQHSTKAWIYYNNVRMFISLHTWRMYHMRRLAGIKVGGANHGCMQPASVPFIRILNLTHL